MTDESTVADVAAQPVDEQVAAIQQQPATRQNAAVVEPVLAAVTELVVPGAVAALETWFADHVRDSVISRDTPAHNRVVTAMAEIVSALASIKE